MKCLRLAHLVLLSVCVCDVFSWQPLVATKEGVVRGLPGRSAAGSLFHSFRGIPYARAPVGPLRFQAPQRHPGWNGVLDATKHGNTCLQKNMAKSYAIEGEEDCLFVNVYTPRLPEPPAAAGLPVMVWIYGGGLVSGDGDDATYGPQYLVDGGVVLVTFNYRVGLLGFFTTDDGVAPGNYGLRDQVLLLQWVQDNIAAFGGDPKLVTIFGESAGGSSVSLLVLSPLSKGLFHHAISQSGVANNLWAASERQLNAAQKLADKLNCTRDSSAQLLDCLRDVNATAIVNQLDPADPWGMVSVRVDRDAEDPVLPESPRRLLESGQFNLVPWMSGITEEESSLFGDMLMADEEHFSKLVARDPAGYAKALGMPVDSRADAFQCGVDPDAEIEKIIDFYTTAHGALTADNLLPLVRMSTDRMFVTPFIEEIRLASAHTAVYTYVLDYSGPGRIILGDVWPEMAALGEARYGVSHGEDVGYLFSTNVTGVRDATSPTYTMIRFMVDVWTTFARTGRPASSVLPMPQWPIYTETSKRHMHLNNPPTVGQRLFETSMNFWNQVPLNDPWKGPVRQGPCIGGKDEL